MGILTTVQQLMSSTLNLRIDHDQASNEEVMSGFLNVVEKIGIMRQARQDEGHYTEMWASRRALIAEDPLKQMTYHSIPYCNPKMNASDLVSFTAENDIALSRVR